jgi:site-specific recombinase XerD
MLNEGASTEEELVVLGFLAGYRGETVRAYASDLRRWSWWCARVEVDLLEVSRAHIEGYAAAMQDEQGMRPATVARRLTTVCGFYRHCTAEGLLARNPGEFVRRPSVPAESTTLGLTYLEFVAFLHAAAQLGPDTCALANLLGMLGLRVSEACHVDIEDLGEQRGHRIVQILGKGAKPAIVPLPVPVARALDAARGDRDHGPLLRTRTGRRMDRHGAARLVRKTCRAAGINVRISPHSLRHTYVTQLLDAGASLRDVQIGARHADPRITMRYDRARLQLDRHVNYVLAARVAGSI